MDFELLAEAINNGNNINLVHTTIQEIKKNKNDILQNLGLNKELLKLYNKQLNEYIFVDNIEHLKTHSYIKWINLNNINENNQEIKLCKGGLLCNIINNNNEIKCLIRSFNNKFFYLSFNSTLIFKKINQEEKIILKAFELLSK